VPELVSPRLRYRKVAAADLDVFHALLVDEHVRRYLLDGQVVPREAAADEIAASERLFAECGIGLWLAFDDAGAVGFCGFRRSDERDLQPHLLYALLHEATGRGLASEMTRALIAYCNELGFAPLRASVDEVNAASVRVLEKAGFRLLGAVTGAFGPMRIYER
jgi:RimJ/RimL family protein N-acetyltransferase